jgi:DNA-binding NtrC family response regulator
MEAKATIESACDRVGVVGSQMRTHLVRELHSKVLLRRARDVVLLTGETGAGKEMTAAVCHEAARDALDRSGELVELNCATLSGSLFESELFGHKRGAFTGADKDYGGLIDRARGGTIVLDEVQALEPQNQAKLLRFLGEREYRRVGDDRTRSSDALIILASNQDLRQRAADGSFRRDLLDRASAKISVPSLHERRNDIGELAQHFAMEAGTDAGLEDFMGLTRRARADVEAAVMANGEVSVRRLREIIRNSVFDAAADGECDAVESDFLRASLEAEFGFNDAVAESEDIRELDEEFDLLLARHQLADLSARHAISKRALQRWCTAIKASLDEMGDTPKSYRNVVDRTSRLAKIALWLVSGAETQADFRRFFGALDGDMPTKSVAHQVYYEVFPKEEDPS